MRVNKILPRLVSRHVHTTTLTKLSTQHSALSTILVLVVALTSNAQTTTNPAPAHDFHRWGVVTLFHGLPSDHVRAIAQQQDGSILFGTEAGLATYDGKRIQKLAANGLLADRINALLVDDEGTVWVGASSGAARVRQGQVDAIAETSGKPITSITASKSGIVLTSEQGFILVINKAQGAPPKVDVLTPQDQYLLNVEVTSTQRVALQLTGAVEADAGGLIVSSRGRSLLSARFEENRGVSEVASRPRPFFIESILRDRPGHLWFGAQTAPSASGLYEATDLAHPALVEAPTGTVTALCLGLDGALWAGTADRGVFCIRDGRVDSHQTFSSTAGGLRSDKIYTVFADREGVIWFGTDKGVSRYDSKGPRFENVSSRGESNFVRTVFRSSDGLLWCGTNRGLFVQRGEGEPWQPVNGLTERIVHAVSEDSLHRILVGTASGLFIGRKSPGSKAVQPGPYSFARASDEGVNVRALSVFRGSVFAAAFGRGLARLDGDTLSFIWPGESEKLDARDLVSLHSDLDHTLWIGTAGSGVFKFDGIQTVRETRLQPLTGCGVWSISGSGEEVLWLATSRGLFALSGDNSQARNADSGSDDLLSVLEGFDARSVYVAPKSGSRFVWCATAGAGLYRIRLGEHTILGRTDAEQGLASQSIFSLLVEHSRDGDDALIMATSRGVGRYGIERLAPQVALVRAVGRRAYEPDEVKAGIDLEYPQNGLSLEVSAQATRTYPEQFQYSFLVSNKSGRRVFSSLAGEPQLLLQGLAPGSYIVEARAYNADLVPSEPLVVSFTVGRAPFPWTSAALAFLLTLATIALVWGWRQNQKLTGTNRELAITRFQLANETESERRRISRDLHDQTLADLRRLMMLVDRHNGSEENGSRKTDSNRFRTEIETISSEIRRICEDLSPSVLTNVGLTAALEWALGNAVSQSPAGEAIQCEFVCEEGVEDRLRLTSAEQIQIFRIVQEALNNVCRHSNATSVRLSIKVAGECLLIDVEDNGKGFKHTEDVVGAGRGLMNICSRASMINGDVSWTDSKLYARETVGGPGSRGTRFRLRKPIA